jgi:hypothetical protein
MVKAVAGKDAEKNDVILHRNNALHVVNLDKIKYLKIRGRYPFLVGEYIIDMSRGQLRMMMHPKANIWVHSTELAVAAAAAAAAAAEAAVMVEWHPN